jgi:hypothetical protein
MAARYDLDGQNSRGQRQILGYSRAVQGGADAARARANQRIYEAQDHMYEDGADVRARRERMQRVATAKKSGEFDSIRDTYNMEADDTVMDRQGNIGSRPKAYLSAGPRYGPAQPAPKPTAARATPLDYNNHEPTQVVNDIVGMTSPQGLVGMAQKARLWGAGRAQSARPPYLQRGKKSSIVPYSPSAVGQATY